LAQRALGSSDTGSENMGYLFMPTLNEVEDDPGFDGLPTFLAQAVWPRSPPALVGNTLQQILHIMTEVTDPPILSMEHMRIGITRACRLMARSECGRAGQPAGFTLPPFWRTDPPLWFASAEAQFLIHRVDAQEIRFAHVVSALQPDVTKELRELILTPPSDRPYETIKERLCSMTDSLREQHIQLQVADEQLGADKPTDFLRRLQEKLGPTCRDDELKTVFIQKLPICTQQVLEPVSQELNVVKLAQLADRIAAQTEQDKANQNEPQCSVRVQIHQLNETLQDLKSVVRQLSHYITITNKVCDLNGNGIKICWYHRRYGGKAFKCARSCALSHTFTSTARHLSGNQD
uniref:C3H1-type domain-containing protein n=1 Tax=Echinostoma caproni TaxID=27848 RepID=A0A183AFT8_9TREM